MEADVKMKNDLCSKEVILLEPPVFCPDYIKYQTGSSGCMSR
jgi:hypothetical protein